MQPLRSRVGVWNSISTWCTLRRWLPVVALATCASAADAQMPLRAQEPVKPMVSGATTPAPNEKTYSVSFNEETWPKVFDWFSKESGLTYIDTVKPPGTLTLRSDRKYTLPQVLDLLNEALAQKKMVVIRRSQTFLVHPADERLPPELVQMITLDDLPSRGDTEVVQLIVPLSTVVAEDIAPQMKKLLSSFGTASAFGSDQVIILDKAKNIRNIQAYIKSIEENNKDQFNHQCKYVRASAAAEQLRTLLVDPNTTTNSTTSTQQPQYSQWGQWGGGSWGQPPQQSSSSRDSRSTQERRFRSVQISVDNPSNTVRLTGPADKVVAARELIKNIDKGDTPRAIGGKEFWKTYNVTPGTAEARAKAVMLLPEFKGSGIQMLTNGTSQAEVYGLPADHLDLENYFKSAETKPNVISETVILNGGDATKMAATISKVLGAKGLIAEARTENNSIWMRGAPEDIAEAKLIIKSDPDGGSVGPVNEKMRVIPIDKANATVLAEEIARMMNQLGHKTTVNGVGTGGRKPEEQPKPMTPPRIAPPGAPMSQAPNAQPNFRQVSAQIVDPQEKPAVTITVVNDQIVITGDDPKAVQLAYEIVRLYTKSSTETTGLEQYTVLKLKNASAVEAAAVINEVFNGPPQQGGAGGAQGGGGRGQGGGGGALASLNPLNFLSSLTGGASAPTNPSAGRVRVVAEKASNSLIVVKASKLDMLTIKDLLSKAIDNDEPPEGGVARTHMIQLTYAKASELAPLVRNVYANASGRTANSRPQQAVGFPFAPQPQQQGSTNVALTVEYEDNTNKLIVNCTDALFQEINKLVSELDKAAKDSAEVVDFVQIKGMSATQIAQAIDALAGRPPVTNTNQRGGFGGGNQGGFGGGQFGGGQFGGGQFGGGQFGGGQFGGGLGTPLGGGFNRPVGGGGAGGLGTGGGTRGGGNTGGGGTRGTGGGGTRPGGGGGRQARLDDNGGRLNFEDRDMDVPSAFGMLFDPEIDQLEGNLKKLENDRSALYTLLAEKVRRAYADPAFGSKTQQVRYQQPEQPGENPPVMPPPQPLPIKPPELGAGFTSPSTDVQVIPLESLGGVIIRGKTKAEVDAIKAIIAAFQGAVQKTSEINIRIVPLEYQDATNITNQLTNVFSRLNFGTGATTFPIGNQQFGGFGFGGQGGAQQQQGSLLLFALPRLNSILLGVPKSREEDIIKEIKKLDVPNEKQMKPVAYPLKRAAAQNVATQLQNFFNQRYLGEQLAQNSIRITYDVPNNTVYVQASPADQIDIKDLIEMWDTSKNLSVSDVRVFRLRNAFSDDLSQVLVQTLLANVVNPQSANTAGGLPAGGGLGGGAQPGLGATGGLGGATGGTALGGAQARPGGALGTLTGGNTGLTTKFVGLRYKSSNWHSRIGIARRCAYCFGMPASTR